ncbi:hypothetical protein K3495_g1545 [Podosphaera aphanis]|nr:hypothetical protein K3495_g1545 [Podosphaera aphanis]
MDEKGFLIGKTQKSRRIFSKEFYEPGKLVGACQDESREWITVIATICVDGSKLSPALIYKATSDGIQDTWLDGFDSGQHKCFFSSSPNGWTSHEHGFHWLTHIFEPETNGKVRRGWRLLFVDGHGSHINRKFLEWCQTHRILVACYPPHSTHRLQPLDVGLFAPLAAFYRQGLNHLIRLTEGFTAMSKRDFFSIFWEAFEKAFTEKKINSAWEKTGIWPFCPSMVQNIFDQPKDLKRNSNALSDEFNSP